MWPHIQPGGVAVAAVLLAAFIWTPVHAQTTMSSCARCSPGTGCDANVCFSMGGLEGWTECGALGGCCWHGGDPCEAVDDGFAANGRVFEAVGLSLLETSVIDELATGRYVLERAGDSQEEASQWMVRRACDQAVLGYVSEEEASRLRPPAAMVDLAAPSQ